MVKLVAVIGVIAIFISATDMAFAGLGKPLPGESKDEALDNLKSSDAYKKAIKVLKEKGFSEERAAVALEKLPRSQVELLGAGVSEVRAGGLLDLLLFVLFVALIVYLIILLVDASTYRGYRY